MRPGADFTEVFNTELTEEEEADFQIWALEESVKSGHDRLKDLQDYDLRGFFKGGHRFDSNNHGTDRFKKPTHPTFSNESIYSGVVAPNGVVYQGGEWGRKDDHDTYTPHPSMFQNGTHDRLKMKRYFMDAEAGNELIFNEEE